MQFKHLFLAIIALLTLSHAVVAQTEHILLKHGSSIQTVAHSPANPFRIANGGDNDKIFTHPQQNCA